MIALLLAAAASGYSAAEEWESAWRRILDRFGRPDPAGAVQQRFAGRQYPQYQLDLWVARPPLWLEQAWAERTSGARLWVHSLDEFDLTNGVQLKARVPIHQAGHLALRYDRLDTRQSRSDLLRLDLGLAGERLSGRISFYPRWEKDDSDLEATVAYAWPGRGEARLRLVALDPFTNASFALAESRRAVLAEHAEQLDLPLGVALEARSARLHGLRGEIDLGGVTEARTRYRHPARPEEDHDRSLSARLAGALVEWQAFDALQVGLEGMAVETETRWDFASGPDRSVDETTWRARLYALAVLPGQVRLEAFAARTLRPEIERQGTARTSRKDAEWLWSARAVWMATRVVGADLAVLRLSRRTSGPPAVFVDGVNHRVVTRLVLALGERVWATFGVGWDPDPGDGLYDGGSCTIVVDE